MRAQRCVTFASNRAIYARMTRVPPLEQSPSDAELLARYADGDHSAARLLTEKHAHRVYALARRMLGDATEAEDIAQEAMLRLWRAAPGWEAGRASVGTWLYRVASNLCIDRIRRRREQSGTDLPDVADETPSALAELEQRDRSAALHDALLRIPERQRLAIVLRHFEDRSNPEIAVVLDTSVEAVESLLARGRRELARELLPRRSELGVTDG